MKKVLVISLIAICFGSNAQTLDGHEKAIEQFIRQFNNQEFDSVYNSFSPEYKNKPPLEVIKMTLASVFRTNGKVVSKELSNTQDEKRTYVLTCDKGAFQTTFRVDGNNLINGMLVKPAEKKTTSSRVFQTDNPLKSQREKNINDLVQNFLNSNKCPGVSIAVIDGQNVEYYNYGETKMGSGKLPTAQSIYDIGSITKTFTAAIFEKLLAQGKIGLQDSLGTYIKGLNGETASIKMVQLLHHTSGLPSMPSPPENVTPGKDPFENYSKDDLLNDLKSIKLQSTPGEKFSYSNLGFATLGLVMESVTGKSYEKMLWKLVLRPTQLKSTRLNLDNIEESSLTQGFTSDASVDYTRLSAMNPAGGLKSNVMDLAKYTKSMYESFEGNKSLRDKVPFTQANGMQVQLSWFVKKSKDNNIYFHNGGTAGYKSFLSFDPVSRKGLVVLSNSKADVTQLGLTMMTGL